MELKIEGKLRDGFFEWYVKKHHNTELAVDRFQWLTQAEQFGSLQEYADTLGKRIVINWEQYKNEPIRWEYFLGKWVEDFDSRTEAQVAAIEKLNEIVNQLKDK